MNYQHIGEQILYEFKNNSKISRPGLSVWPWLGQAAGHTSLMLFLPTFIIIIHRLNDKTEIKYEIKVSYNNNNV